MTKMQLEALSLSLGEGNVDAINRNLRRLDALSNLVLQSVSDTTEPNAPIASQVWWIPLGGVGTNWTGHGGELAVFTEDGWHFMPVWEGCHGHVVDELKLRVYKSGSWNDPDVVKRVVYRIVNPQTGDAKRVFYALGNVRVTRVVYVISQFQANVATIPTATPTLVAGGTTLVSAWSDNAGEEWVGTLAVDTVIAPEWIEFNVGTVTGAPFMITVQIQYTENVGV